MVLIYNKKHLSTEYRTVPSQSALTLYRLKDIEKNGRKRDHSASLPPPPQPAEHSKHCASARVAVGLYGAFMVHTVP